MPFPYISPPMRTIPEAHNITAHLSATSRLVVEAWLSDGESARWDYNERFADQFATGHRQRRTKPTATLMVLLRHDIQLPRVPEDWHPAGVGRTMVFELHGDPDLLPELDFPTTLSKYHDGASTQGGHPDEAFVAGRLTAELRDLIRRQQATGWGQFEQPGEFWDNIGYLVYLIRAARLSVAAAAERMGVEETVLRGWLNPCTDERPTQEALAAITSAARAALAEHGAFFY